MPNIEIACAVLVDVVLESKPAYGTLESMLKVDDLRLLRFIGFKYHGRTYRAAPGEIVAAGNVALNAKQLGVEVMRQ